MATRTTPRKAPTTKAPEITQTGANITNCHIENRAAPVSDIAAEALAELARASTAHANALSDIAKALRGAEAHMQYGIHLSDVCASKP